MSPNCWHPCFCGGTGYAASIPNHNILREIQYGELVVNQDREMDEVEWGGTLVKPMDDVTRPLGCRKEKKWRDDWSRKDMQEGL